MNNIHDGRKKAPNNEVILRIHSMGITSGAGR